MRGLSSITVGSADRPDYICLYGVPGIGKTTFAAQAPSPIVSGPEDGLGKLKIDRFPVARSWEECLEDVNELLTKPHNYKTYVGDSVDQMELLLHKKIVSEDSGGAQTILKCAGGFGNGPKLAEKYWLEYLNLLSDLRDKKEMNIILIGHADIKSVSDPQLNATYQKYTLKLTKESAALIKEKCEVLLFANYEVYAKVDAQKKTRAYGDGVRIVHSETRPGHDAKNRFGLPSTFPLDWNEYIKAKKAGTPEDPITVSNNIKELLLSISDVKLKENVNAAVAAASGDAEKLIRIQNKLRTMLNN